MDKAVTILQNSLDNLITLIKVFFLSKRGNKISKTSINTEKVMILGNGPSLKVELEKESFLAELKVTDFLVVNYFCDSDFFKQIKPEYYIIVAPEIWERESRHKLFHSLIEVDWEMNLFMPFLAKKHKKWQEILAKNDNLNIVFVNTVGIDGSFYLKEKLYNLKLAMPRLHNVIGPSLMTMIGLDYKEIDLYGVEHSWLPLINVSADNTVYVGQPHFYEKSEQEVKPMNSMTGQRKLHEVLDKFYLSFKGYFEIKKYAELKNVKIYNCTKHSFIDAFEKK